jgi:methylmalonyl-CoA mutase, C-terminal domain
MIVQAAIDEDVDVIGLSVLSGAHMALTAAVMDELCASDVDEIKVVVGGTIPSGDASRLRDLGVTAVFGVGTHIDEIREWFRNQ